jgi:hypothetical protein
MRVRISRKDAKAQKQESQRKQRRILKQNSRPLLSAFASLRETIFLFLSLGETA